MQRRRLPGRTEPSGENMKSAIAVGAAGVAVSFMMLGAGFVAGNRQAAAPQPQPQQLAAIAGDRAQIEQIVRDYLINNPEIMVDVQAALDAKQHADQEVVQREAIRAASQEIYASAQDGVIGNPQGTETIVEFFDYNCHYCRQALGDMQALVKDDPKLRFVMKEFPILGPDSQKASIVSMAFRELMPDKYGEFHVQLLGSPGRATEDGAIKIALSLGADETALRAKMKDPGIVKAVNANYDLAKRLDISGTPSYVVGDQVIFGAMGRDVLAEKVADARDCPNGMC